ncbi:MAG: hypothetical protein M1840_008607 [Geoglossum simile]|nr:MAG: hypothetical protein M1840_008607 [Geoglossum simile]
MVSLRLRHLFLFAFLLAVLSSFVLADELSDDESEANFQILLNSVPEDRLHAVLHDYDPTKFKHGVFQEDRTAMEAVHRNNPAVATKLIHLAKRQSNNTTTTNNTPIATAPPTKSTSAPKNPTSTQKGATTQTLQSTFITSQFVKTSTLPDGSRSTVTEFTVVGSPVESPVASNSKNGSPTLQTNGAIRNGRLGAMGGLVGGVMAGILAL